MPYKDPKRKQETMRKWRKRVMDQGYGRWLYQRRKLRFDDAERFRFAIERTLAVLAEEPLTAETTPASTAIDILATALRESQEAEDDLGPWKGGDHDEAGS